MREKGATVEYLTGTMIELPRAAITAGLVQPGSVLARSIQSTTIPVCPSGMPLRTTNQPFCA